MAERHLTPSVVAGLTGLALATLAKKRVSGKGPPFKRLGGRIVYPESALQKWLDDQPLMSSTAEGDVRRPNAGRPRKRSTSVRKPAQSEGA